MGKSSATGLLLISCILFVSLFVSTEAQTCRDYSFSKNKVYATCSALTVLDSYLHWTYHSGNNTADIAFRKSGASTSNWVSWALNPSGMTMPGCQALVAYESNGVMNVYTTPIANKSPTMQSGSLSFNVTNLSAEFADNNLIIYATLHLTRDLVSTNQVWQEGPVSGTSLGIHPTSGDNLRSFASVNFQTGATAVGSGSNSVTHKRNVHGVINVVSWGILMPVGVMMARYLKVFKVANPAWFYLHAACQSSAYVVGVAGFATGIKLGKDSSGITRTEHRNMGIALFCLSTLQVFALLLRPKPDHKYRFYWNIYHHSMGYATIILSIVNIFEGFEILDPEKKWKKAYIGILIFLGAVAAVLEAFTWYVIIRRKRTESSHKYANGTTTASTTNGVNGYANRTTLQSV